MKPLGQFFLFGIAAAFILGVTFVKESTPFPVLILLGVLITLASTFIFLYKPKAQRVQQASKAAEGLVPGTKEWAEALYAHGFVSADELKDYLAKLNQ